MEEHGERDYEQISAPRRMVHEIRALQAQTHDLIKILEQSSVPIGFRRATGNHIHESIAKVLDLDIQLKLLSVEVYEHQERQWIVREKLDSVQNAERNIDVLVEQLQKIEAELVLLIHRTENLSTTSQAHGDGTSNAQELLVEEVINYSCHCSFTTSCGIRWFGPDGRPMHSHEHRDERYLSPFPAAHSMRLQGGLWDHRSKRRPEPPAQKSSLGVGGGDETRADTHESRDQPATSLPQDEEDGGREAKRARRDDEESRRDEGSRRDTSPEAVESNQANLDTGGEGNDGWGESSESEAEASADDDFVMDLNAPGAAGADASDNEQQNVASHEQPCADEEEGMDQKTNGDHTEAETKWDGDEMVAAPTDEVADDKAHNSKGNDGGADSSSEEELEEWEG